jgi:hypothetical protein
MNPTLIFFARRLSNSTLSDEGAAIEQYPVQREIIANKGVISVLRAIRQSDSNRIYDSLNVGL